MSQADRRDDVAVPSRPAGGKGRLRRAGRRALRGVAGLLCVWGSLAHADGGHIALRAVSGSYSVTLFTAPDPLVSGPVDLSLLVQDAASGEVVSEAEAGGSLARAGGEPIPVSLTHAGASNKLLMAAMPTLEKPGIYTFMFHVERPGSPPASFRVDLVVAADHRRRTTLVFALLLPMVVIVLFLVNQQAKRGRGHRRSALH